MRLNDLGQFVSFLIRISTLSPELIRQFAELELVESTLSAKQAGLAKSFASLVETITAALPVIGAATGVIAAIGAAAIIARKQMEANDFGYAVEKTQKEVKALQDLEAESKNVAWQIHDLNKQKASGDFTQQQQIELELLKAQRKVLEDQVKLYRDRVEAAKNHERETAIRTANSLLNPSENDKLYGSTIDQAIISYSFAREKLNSKPDNAGYNRLFKSASDEVLRYVEEINSLIASLNPDSDKDIINALSGKLQEINSLLGVTENTAYDAVAEVKGLIKEAYDAANIEQLGKQSAETISKRMEPALDSFRRKLKYLRADIIRSIGYGYELSEEQTKEYYKWLDAMGYLSGETDEITAKADQLRKDFKAFFAAESPDKITEKSVAARLRQAAEDFQSIRESLNNGSFGNVSMPDNAIELNTDNIKKFKSELEALGQTSDSLKDKTSAIFANWGTFDGVDIAFTPVLHIENEDGSKEPVLLSPDTVNEYISKVLEKAKAEGGGELSADLILKVDAAGLDGFDKVRGRIQGLIAAVGDTAEITSMLLNDIAANSEDTAAALLVAGENLEYAIDSAMGYIRNVIGAQLADFASLRNEIEHTAKAWEEYQNLIAGGDPSDWANKFEEAYSKAMTDIENGRPDTAAVWGAAKLFFSDEQLAEMGWSLSRAAQELQKGFFKELFSDPEDIEDADKLDIGAKFVNWLNKNKDSLKSASFSVDGSGMFSFIYDSEEALAKELDISTEAVTVLLKAMDAFGVECMRSKEDNDRLIESFKKMFEIVNSTAGVIDDDLKDALSNAFGGLTDEELNQRIEEVKDSIGNLGSLQTVLNEFAAGLRLGGMQENHIMDILLNMKENIEEISGTTLTVDKNGNITEFNNAITYANDELRTLNEQNPTPSVSLDTSDGEEKAKAFREFCNTTFEGMNYSATITPEMDENAYNSIKNRLAQLTAPVDHQASGTRNAPGGVTLVNELGPELISDNGVAYIANGGKPGFTNLNKGAIVFNADETRQIFSRSYPDAEYPSFAGGTSNGQIKRNMITGMMVPGKAFVSQTGYFPTASTAKRNPTAKKSTRETDYTPRSSYDRDYSNYDNYDSYDSYEEEKLTKLDWIEKLLNRIQRSISSLEKIASSGFKSLSTRTTAATKEIEWLSKEINAQQRAYTRYMQEANAVGLDAYLMGKVQRGDYNIEEYDEQTAELITQYTEWYEKALDCKDAVEDLRLEIAQLYKTMFDNTQADFENQLAVIEYSANIINRALDENKARGYLDSVEFYKELSDVEAQSIEKMNEELEALHQRYLEAMDSGEIEAYSEEWYSMIAAIESVEGAIADANVQLIEYEKTMRSLEWSYFDYIQDRFGQLQKESEFLIGIMQNDKLFEDNGVYTAKGNATMGLRVMNYNAYMAQADAYAKEMLRVSEALASDPNDTALIERRETLLGLQQQMIQAAESEKDAIRDLVSNGIQLELSSLKELIDQYTESLEASKSLYDYQKRISEKTGDIAKIQKQLTAYSGDNSEENRARVQKLQEDLQKAQEDLAETEWERDIEDRKKLLNDLYDEYSELLNQRLDDLEGLVSDAVESVNSGSEEINAEIRESAEQVGYEITDGMRQVLNDGVYAHYDRMFEGVTSVNGYLSSIERMVAGMVKHSDEAAPMRSTSGMNSDLFEEDTQSTPLSLSQSLIQGAGQYTGKGSAGGSSSVTPGIYSMNILGYPTTFTVDENGKGTIKVTNPNPQPGGAYTGKTSFDAEELLRRPDIKRDLLYGLLDDFNKNIDKAALEHVVLPFSSGGINDYTGLAMLHGTKERPELVLNAGDTEKFLKAAEIMRTPMVSSLLEHNLRLSTFESGGASGDVIVNLGGISIEHVQDYNDFVTQLRDDPKFERLIDAMTFDKMNGKSSFGGKNKIKW